MHERKSCQSYFITRVNSKLWIIRKMSVSFMLVWITLQITCAVRCVIFSHGAKFRWPPEFLSKEYIIYFYSVEVGSIILFSLSMTYYYHGIIQWYAKWMMCGSPSLPHLAGGEDGPVPWVEGEQWVRGTGPLELLVREVPIIRVIHEDPAQRRLGPAILRKKDKLRYGIQNLVIKSTWWTSLVPSDRPRASRCCDASVIVCFVYYKVSVSEWRQYK